MALKDDLNDIKKELSAQEQMIEGFIRGEKFFKKYKYIIISLIIIILAYVLYTYISSTIKENNIKNSNELYISLLRDIKSQNYDTSKEEELKKTNPNLYVFLLLAKHLDEDKFLEESKNLDLDPLLKEILNYEQSNFLLDYDKLLQAYDLLKQDKIEEARILLDQIPSISELKQIADNLKHYQGKKNE